MCACVCVCVCMCVVCVVCVCCVCGVCVCVCGVCVGVGVNKFVCQGQGHVRASYVVAILVLSTSYRSQILLYQSGSAKLT